MAVPFFDAKVRIEEYVKAQHPGMTAAFPFPAAFYTNFAEYQLARCVRAAETSFTILPVGSHCIWFMLCHASL